MRNVALLIAATTIGAVHTQSEPSPRTLTAVPLKLELDLAEVAAVRELPDGRLLISDAGAPAILVVDPATGAMRKLGREGQGPNEYGKPGGIYYDADGTTSLVLDRSQPRVLVVDKTGTLTGMRSIEVRGLRMAADGHDPQRIDAALHSYFIDQGAAFKAQLGRGSDSVPLLRFDVARQKSDTAAMIFQTKPTVMSAKGNMTFSRTPIFAPADGWSVAADGSVAVVRSTPYRVDWIDPRGQVTPGAAVAYTPVPVTAADREMREKSSASVSGGGSKNGQSMSMSGADFKPEYMPVKPAFDPQAIVSAPDGHLWVGRLLPASAKQVVYDVFDRRGARVDRVAFPARSHIVGFGPTSVYAAELDDDDLPHLRKYRLTR